MEQGVRVGQVQPHPRGLMGWCAADEQAVRSKGTMYFVIHPQGRSMTGRWVGLSYDGTVVTGWAAMAKTSPRPLR